MSGPTGDHHGRHRRPLATAALGLALALTGTLLAACGQSPSAGRALTVYSGQHPQTTAALVAAFERRTGIQVNVRNDDEDVLANQIILEGSNSPADVFISENSPPLESLQEKGLLAPVDRSTLAAVPAADSSPAGRWVGVSARVSVMVYNTRLLRPSQLPRSVLDLADPRWRGRVALAQGETDFQPVVTAVADTYGQARALQWLQGLKANASSHLYPDNETVTSMVNRGQAAISIIDQYYWYRLRAVSGASAMHSAIAFFAPRDPGYVLDISGAAVVAASRHRAEAQRFLAFLVSRQGQSLIVHSDSFEYPLLPGLAPAGGQPPLASLQPVPLSIARLGDGSEAINLLQQVQLL